MRCFTVHDVVRTSAFVHKERTISLHILGDKTEEKHFCWPNLMLLNKTCYVLGSV